MSKDSQNIKLRNHPILRNKTFVLLSAYMRGGSSFLGQMIALNPNAFYWFEIVEPMYGAMMGLRLHSNTYDITHHVNGTKRSVFKVEF